jgi:hypothetical protein
MASTKTLPAPELSVPQIKKWKTEQAAFRRLLPDLLRTQIGEFVAIHEGQVVESGVDKIEVARRAYERFGYIPIFVSQVIAGSPEPIRVPSTRRIDGAGA